MTVATDISLRGRDLLSLFELSRDEFHAWLVAASLDLKRRWRDGDRPRPLEHRTIAMIFEKQSLRTRSTFDIAMYQLGGHSVLLSQNYIGWGVRETIRDVAHNLERWVDGIMARTYGHTTLLELAEHADVPVINGLSDMHHPCQLLADYLTLLETFGDPRGLTVAFVGDGNNVCNSHVERRRSPGTAARRLPRRLRPRRRGARSGPVRAAPRSRSCATRARRCVAPTCSTPTSGSRWARRRRPSAAARVRRLHGHAGVVRRPVAPRRVHARPARALRRGVHRGRRVPRALGGVRPGREPPPRPQGRAGRAAGGPPCGDDPRRRPRRQRLRRRWADRAARAPSRRRAGRRRVAPVPRASRRTPPGRTWRASSSSTSSTPTRCWRAPRWCSPPRRTAPPRRWWPRRAPPARASSTCRPTSARPDTYRTWYGEHPHPELLAGRRLRSARAAPRASSRVPPSSPAPAATPPP
jgi:hypothetical protein